MFSYSVPIEDRLAKLQRLVSEGDHCIALVVAAADFERTMRRAIVSLSLEPTADVRERIEKKYNSIGRYHQAWTRFVEPARILPLSDVLPEFDDVKNAFQARNKLVHGQQGGAKLDYVMPRLDVTSSGTTKLTVLSLAHGIDLTLRIKVRQRPRSRQQP
jgi:hypothetical protein